VTAPFCVVECGDEIPAKSDQCFLAAGLVVVFHRIGEPYPFGVDFIGIRGSSKAPSIPSDVMISGHAISLHCRRSSIYSI
jgi:hypothetical protein